MIANGAGSANKTVNRAVIGHRGRLYRNTESGELDVPLDGNMMRGFGLDGKEVTVGRADVDGPARAEDSAARPGGAWQADNPFQLTCPYGVDKAKAAACRVAAELIPEIRLNMHGQLSGRIIDLWNWNRGVWVEYTKKIIVCQRNFGKMCRTSFGLPSIKGCVF